MSDKQTYRITTLEELRGVADAFIMKYPESGVFALKGEMAAGKTTFVRAVCKALKLEDASSPTFSLVNHYENGKSSVYHFDLYRLKNIEEALDFGIEEYLDRRAYLFIEWPEIVQSLLPEHTVEITISDDLGTREIIF